MQTKGLCLTASEPRLQRHVFKPGAMWHLHGARHDEHDRGLLREHVSYRNPCPSCSVKHLRERKCLHSWMKSRQLGSRGRRLRLELGWESAVLLTLLLRLCLRGSSELCFHHTTWKKHVANVPTLPALKASSQNHSSVPGSLGWGHTGLNFLFSLVYSTGLMIGMHLY